MKPHISFSNELSPKELFEAMGKDETEIRRVCDETLKQLDQATNRQRQLMEYLLANDDENESFDEFMNLGHVIDKFTCKLNYYEALIKKNLMQKKLKTNDLSSVPTKELRQAHSEAHQEVIDGYSD